MPKIPYWIRKPILRGFRRRAQALARRRLRANEPLWALLHGYLERTQSKGCEYIDYDVLYRHIRRSKPLEVLECGTGVSTVVIAHALRENALRDGVQGRVVSMEDVDYWFEMATRLMPAALRDHVEIRLSPRIEDGYTLFRGVRYRDVPDRRYDLVFVDGPDTLAPSDGTRCFDFDFVHVVRRSEHPVLGIIDGRLTTCYVLQKIFGPEKFRFHASENLGYIGPVTKSDLRTITRSSSIALAHSLRLWARTRFHLAMEPPTAINREPQ